MSEFINKAAWYTGDTEKTKVTTTNSTPDSSSTVTITHPTKSTSGSTQYEYDAATLQGATSQGDKVMTDLGYEKDAQGNWKRKDNYLSTVLNMQKHNQEVERINRAKALNAGLFNTISTIGDMISAGTGGNVYKREKNTVAEDAAKDTIARRDAIHAAEMTAKEKEDEMLQSALAKARDAYNKHLEMNRKQVTTQEITTSGDEIRKTETKGGQQTQTVSTTKTGGKQEFVPIAIRKADGSVAELQIEKSAADAYQTQLLNAINSIDLNAEANKGLKDYALNKGYLDDYGNWDFSKKLSFILSDATIFDKLPEAIKKANRDLYWKSREFAVYAKGDYQKLDETQRKAKEAEINGSLYGYDD